MPRWRFAESCGDLESRMNSRRAGAVADQEVGSPTTPRSRRRAKTPGAGAADRSRNGVANRGQRQLALRLFRR